MTSTSDTAESRRADDVEVDTRWPTAAVVLVGFVGMAGLLLRWLVLRSPAGTLTADEAYTGVQGFEIAGGHFPIVLGGTAYTLPFEAYLYAPLAALLGTNVALLKLLTTLSWALASVAIYFAATRLANRRTALIAGSLCWLAPGALLLVSVTSYSAYASGMLVAICAFYVAAVLIDSDEPNRWMLFGFGVLAGFGFWLHPMFVATLVPMALVVLWIHRRRLEAWVAVIAGGLLGCAPLLLWNVKNSWPSLESPTQVEGTYLERLRTFGADLMPRAFGLRDITLRWQPDNIVAPMLYITIVALAVYGMIVAFRRSERRSRVLLPAVLLSVFPIMALFENLIFAFDGRYGIISFPFIVLALAAGIDSLAGRESTGRTAAVFTTVVAVWVFGLVVPTVRPLVDATDGDPNAHLRAAVAALDEAGIDRIYGSYWGVLPVEFMGDKELVGGVFPFWPIRFPERQRTVEAESFDDIAIVFVDTDEDLSQLPLPGERYERQTFGNIVIYFPTSSSNAE